MSLNHLLNYRGQDQDFKLGCEDVVVNNEMKNTAVSWKLTTEPVLDQYLKFDENNKLTTGNSDAVTFREYENYNVVLPPSLGNLWTRNAIIQKINNRVARASFNIQAAAFVEQSNRDIIINLTLPTQAYSTSVTTSQYGRALALDLTASQNILSGMIKTSNGVNFEIRLDSADQTSYVFTDLSYYQFVAEITYRLE